MKVAYYSPLPPETTGIADYSALLLPALGRKLDVEAVRRDRPRHPKDADVALYHVGNSPEAHGWILEALRRRPGVVVLHDFVLHHLVAGLTLGRKDGDGYLAAMQREAGLPGRLLGLGTIDGCVPPLWEAKPEEFPLCGEVLDRATGLVVHSAYVERRAREQGFDGPLWRIPHPSWTPPSGEPARLEGGPWIGSFGNVNPSKRIPQLLEAFAGVHARHPGARLLLVGAVAPGFDVARRLERLGLDDGSVRLEGRVDETQLWALMRACDVHVGLRSPTMGETSGTAIRALSLGHPLVVSDVGWFSELPNEVAIKVPVDTAETASLAAALELLATNDGARRSMGAAALELAQTEHDVERVAEAYAAALEEAAGGSAVRDAVTAEIARAAADVGIGVDV